MGEQNQKKAGVYEAISKNGTIYYRASLTYRNKHISLGSFETEQEAHFTPDYAREDLIEVLKEDRIKEKYGLIFQQTGLAPLAVDTLISQGREQEILAR